MKYETPLIRVKLIKRYKRFLADVLLDDGTQITVHTPNTGSMKGCSEPGSYIWIRDSGNPKRKYLYSWEMSELSSGVMVGVNTGLANHLAAEAISSGVVESLASYGEIKTEVPYGQERSRIDLLLKDPEEKQPDCYVEVKNVTARDGQHAIFPDAVTARGTKHLRELSHVVAEGGRGVIFFNVQREDVDVFRPAHEIDPLYAETLAKVVGEGVEVLAYRASITPSEVFLDRALPVEI
ncbi:DNA/RNA nuclease SfsA [Pseudomonadota bacterium]